MSTLEHLPSYRDLPVVENAPPGSAWHLWGPDDQLGTLNLLTDERRCARRKASGTAASLL